MSTRMFQAPTPGMAARLARNLRQRGYRVSTHGRVVRVESGGGEVFGGEAFDGDGMLRVVAAHYAALEVGR
jgi:hypothetical protein